MSRGSASRGSANGRMGGRLDAMESMDVEVANRTRTIRAMTQSGLDMMWSPNRRTDSLRTR